MNRPYFSFQWHLLDDCDQRCKHCYIYSGSDVQLQRMPYPDMLHVLDNIEDFCDAFGRSPYLYITGGDPILHPDFWELMKELRSRGIPFTIMGNPFHLTDEVCARLHDCGCVRYQLSIDGMRETHDWFRRPGSYDETMARIPMLKRNGIRTVVMTTVSDVNADQLPDIIDAVVAAGADVFSFSRYVPTAGGNMSGLSPQAYHNVLDTAYHKFKEYEDAGCPTYFNRKDHLWTLYEWEEGLWSIPEGAKTGIVYGGCNCGSGHLTITPAGDVLACRRVGESKVGNALADRIAELWLGPTEGYRDVDAFSKCSRCELLAWCRGCPGVAKAAGGSFYSADPQCWHEVSDGDAAHEPKEAARAGERR
jgi:radical SAM/SPASM domain protein of ACGX system